MTIKFNKKTEYIVTYGPEKEADRESKNFNEKDKALEFFKKKDEASLHVDAYEVETQTTVKTKKLSK